MEEERHTDATRHSGVASLKYISLTHSGYKVLYGIISSLRYLNLAYLLVPWHPNSSTRPLMSI